MQKSSETGRTVKTSEDDLCRAFAEAVRTSPKFRGAVLSRTKFAASATTARLLWEEQVRARPKVLPDRWWRHWWCKIPEVNRERETDIFLVFEDEVTAERFALHVENKLEASFTDGQAADYEPRGRHMLNKPRYLSHGDFATMLVCPAAYAELRADQANVFGSVLSHEEIGAHVPEFAAS